MSGAFLSETFLSTGPQARHQCPEDGQQHAGCVGEDRVQLAGPGPLPLDPPGTARLPRPGVQLSRPRLSSFIWWLSSVSLFLP